MIFLLVSHSTVFVLWLYLMVTVQGVSNLVGDAVAMNRSFIDSIPVIGVNSWGAVANNQQLVSRDVRLTQSIL